MNKNLHIFSKSCKQQLSSKKYCRKILKKLVILFQIRQFQNLKSRSKYLERLYFYILIRYFKASYYYLRYP